MNENSKPVRQGVHGHEIDASPDQASPITELKFYSPVFCDMWGDSDIYNDYPAEVHPQTATWYHAEIKAALDEERALVNSERGLMDYYSGEAADTINKKVLSMSIDVEMHCKQLWAVATLTITEPLTSAEQQSIREYIEGQYADGFGEGFGQRYIKVEDGELNVHLWKYGDKFFIDTQEEFAKRYNLPCLSKQPTQTDICNNEKPSALNLIRQGTKEAQHHCNAQNRVKGQRKSNSKSELR